jgi:hypothetical protein
MENPYHPPKELPNRRLFSTPLIVPISVMMVVAIYAGYAFYFFTRGDAEILSGLATRSLECFLLVEVGMIWLIFYNKRSLDRFLLEHPVIENRRALEKLKPIVRTNMYSSLLMMLLIATSALTAVMTLLNRGGGAALLVILFSLGTGKLVQWYNQSEEKVKQVACSDDALEKELLEILHCWLHKAFPNF